MMECIVYLQLDIMLFIQAKKFYFRLIRLQNNLPKIGSYCHGLEQTLLSVIFGE